MKTMLALAASSMLLAFPAFAAVNKDGEQPSVNPCGAETDACAGQPVVADNEPVTEPQVVFLDADGKTLVRMPLSKFKVSEPAVKLPSDADRAH